jgi:pyruvate formate lyase activating enzyme
MVYLAGYESLSTVDWIGRLSTVFWFSGCNMRCRFCYNHKFLYKQDGVWFSLGDIYNIMKDNKILIDSIVMTGGEPTLQAGDVEDIAKAGKSLSLDVMLDTNGSNPYKVLTFIHNGLIDRVAIDAKAPFMREAWLDMCGQDFHEEVEFIMSNAKKLGAELEIRTTVVPTTWSDPEHIPSIIENVKDYADEYHLQQFDSSDPYDRSLREIDTVPVDVLMELGQLAKDSGIPVVYVKSKGGIKSI